VRANGSVDRDESVNNMCADVPLSIAEDLIYKGVKWHGSLDSSEE
jgi:hypothetical protein